MTQLPGTVINGRRLPRIETLKLSIIGFLAGWQAAGGMDIGAPMMLTLSVMIPSLESSLRNTAGAPNRAYGSHQFIRSHTGKKYGEVYFNDRTNPVQSAYVTAWQIAKFLKNNPQFADRVGQTALFYHWLGINGCLAPLNGKRWKGKSTKGLPAPNSMLVQGAEYYYKGLDRVIEGINMARDTFMTMFPELELSDTVDEIAIARGILASQLATLAKISLTEPYASRETYDKISGLYMDMLNHK